MPLPDEPLPPMLGRYALELSAAGQPVELGRGGMGVTYLARDPQLGRAVVLKVLLPGTAADADARARFLREARALAEIQHPHIPIIYEFGVSADGATDYYAMELLQGEDLAKVVKRDGPLPVSAVLAAGRQTASALAAAHARNIIHRDLKPANLMSLRGPSPTGEPLFLKLIDFGLARKVGKGSDWAAITRTGQVGGLTVLFASPEQIQGLDLDHRTDLYSLGITLWWLLTGKSPFTGSTAFEVQHKHLHLPPPFELLPGNVSAGFRDLLAALLAKDPEDRPGTAAAVEERISRLAESGSDPARPVDLGLGETVRAPARRESPSATEGAPDPLGTEATLRNPVPVGRSRLWAAVALPLAAGAGWLAFRSLPPASPPPAAPVAAIVPAPANPTPLPRVEVATPAPTTAPAPSPTRPSIAEVTPLPGPLVQAPGTQPFVNSLRMRLWPVPGTSVRFAEFETRISDFVRFTADDGYVAATEEQKKRMREIGMGFRGARPGGGPGGGGMRPPLPAGSNLPPGAGGPAPPSEGGDKTESAAGPEAAVSRALELWREPGYEKTPNFPVTFVSWDDAQAFCRWLTEKERKERRLTASQRYRLPTDAEWSAAVGLPAETATSPESRNAAAPAIYPWDGGRGGWPPPKDAGNYGAPLRAGATENRPVPAGSFTAGAWGLQDLGGNVWEWVEDAAAPGSPLRTARGGSFLETDRTSLKSAARDFQPATHRAVDRGFRVVLE